jgi:hypothetical protein
LKLVTMSTGASSNGSSSQPSSSIASSPAGAGILSSANCASANSMASAEETMGASAGDNRARAWNVSHNCWQAASNSRCAETSRSMTRPP